MCSTCSKNHPPNSKHPPKEHSNVESGKSAHVLDRVEDTGRKSVSKMTASKGRVSEPHNRVSPAITNQDLKEAADGVNTESLFQILGGIEDEYRQAKA